MSGTPSCGPSGRLPHGEPVHARGVVGTPLWSEVTTVRGHRRRVRVLDVAVPQTARTLIAVAECEVDDNPGNNLAGIPVVGWTDPGTGDPPPTPIDPAILAGAATCSAGCAVCHGADGRGPSAGPNLLHRSAGDLYESLQKGPGAMPTFPDLTRTDASNVSRFLEDPAAATPPPPPDPGPVPDPTPTPPTYTADVEPYLDASCAVCHKGSTAPRKIKLDSCANASANAQATLTAMQGDTMPPGNPATAGQIQRVADWIAAGLPQ